jgi:hypothetical protein
MIIIEGKGAKVRQGKMLVRCEGASWGEGGRRSVVDSNNVELKLCFWSRDHAGVSSLYFKWRIRTGGPSTSARASKSRGGEGVLTREIACEQWRY